MTKQVLVDAVCQDEIRVALVENNNILQLEQDSVVKKKVKGNIYLGSITRIEASLQAVFIEYGSEKQGFLSFLDIMPHYYQINSYEKESFLNFSPEDLLKHYSIQEVLKIGQELLVQVTKEERGNKGVSFTTHVTIPGKYCVFIPYSDNRSLSKKINDGNERKKLNTMLNQLDTKNGGIILRKSAIGKSSKVITSDYKYLSELWDGVQEKFIQPSASKLVLEQNDIIHKILCDFSDGDVENIIVDGSDCYKTIKEKARIILPHEKLSIKLYRRRIPIFEYYEIERQITELYNNRTTLPSGGYIIISPTEALIAIDINSGKMTDGLNIEETAYRTNLEAAYEIAKQTELRGLSGLIVIDFIDMLKYKNCRLIKSAVEEAFNEFSANVQIGDISEFGLMEVSKQRTKKSIFESNARVCDYCLGSGYLQSHESTFLKILKAIYHYNNYSSIQIISTQQVVLYIFNEQYERIKSIEDELNMKITISIDDNLSNENFHIKRIKTYQDEKKNESSEKSTLNSWIKNWLSKILSTGDHQKTP